MTTVVVRDGLTTLRLETARHDDAAMALYERSGFRPCEPFGRYPDHPVSAFMQKDLVPAARST